MKAAKAALQKCPKCPQKAAMKCSRSSPAKAAKAAMKCKAAKAMKVGRPRKCSKVKKAMKVAECSKVKKAMKVAECSKVKKAMKAMKEWKVAMKAAKVAMKAECSKIKKAMKAVECLKATKAKMDEMKPTKIPLDLEKLAKAANEGQELNMWVDLGKEMIARRYDHRLQGTGRDARRQEQVETRGATITDSKEQVETLGATIRDSKEQVETLGSTIYAGCLPDSKEQVAQKVWEPDDDERWEVLVLGYFWKNGRPKFKYIIIEKEVECKKDADFRQP